MASRHSLVQTCSSCAHCQAQSAWPLAGLLPVPAHQPAALFNSIFSSSVSRALALCVAFPLGRCCEGQIHARPHAAHRKYNLVANLHRPFRAMQLPREHRSNKLVTKPTTVTTTIGTLLALGKIVLCHQLHLVHHLLPDLFMPHATPLHHLQQHISNLGSWIKVGAA